MSADIVYSQGPLRASFVYCSWRNHAIALVSGLGLSPFLGQSLAGGQTFVTRTQDIFGLSALYRATPHLDLHGVLTQVNLSTQTQSAKMRTAELGADYHVTPTNTASLLLTHTKARTELVFAAGRLPPGFVGHAATRLSYWQR
ncbi:hypothetical protein [Paraburkholderia sediminicola]|uniref:hypothetical protein n=1 Tax=Paraburkholderia sediminicola TaxID=458836 RepID=UPI0038B8FFB6